MEKKYVCPLCGYVYDGEIPFEELPDSYLCPLCGAAKSDFIEQEA
ncbi:MAG: rubredoxin [Oscillospiraceae bacterium]